MSSIRTLLLWLLMLAVPAQAVTAATMAFCGPNHHGSGASGLAQAAAASADAHQHGAAGHAHHAHAVAHAVDDAADADAATAADAEPSSKALHGDQQKCSACASCCSVGAWPGTTLAVPVLEFAGAVFASSVPTVDAFAAGGPDRPPRPILA